MWLRRKTKSTDSKATHNKVKATQSMDTLVGIRTKIEGDMHFTGGLHVDGEVHGNIEAQTDEPSLLIVGKNAKITGDVKVHRAVVNGHIVGKLYVYDHLELGERAFVQGDVHYNLLEMAVGSEVRGLLIPDIKKEPRNLLEDHSVRDAKAKQNSKQKIELEIEETV